MLDATVDMALKTNRHIAIFSWNINGIQSFLPPTTAPITSFFKLVGEKQKLDKSKQKSFSNPLRAFLKRHHWPEILFLQEIKISPSDKKTPAALSSTVNTSLGKHDILSNQKRYTVDVNLPRDKFNARGFGGKVHGVGTLIREDFASQYVSCTRHAEWDLEGRVTIVELHTGTPAGHSLSGPATNPDYPEEDAGPRQPLALVNVYAVNGTANPYRSPDTGKVTGTRHDHKLAFHRRLRDECAALERRGFAVVIAGDLNIARGALDGWPSLRTYPRQHCLNRADFNRLFFGAEDNARAEAYLGSNFEDHDHIQDTRQREQSDSGPPRLNGLPLSTAPSTFDGVDVFRALHGKKRQYTYHPRSGEAWGTSCDRVDLIITSKSLHEFGRVIATGILDTPQERGTSDHVPLWVKILYPGTGAA